MRSFGDDRLRLWTATLGRPSFIERFSPRRFDAFEEVLARHLARLGPVIAVNPPGTELPPLGAARATLDPADWHSAIVTWMEQSARIVFVLPPQHAGPGLLWELGTVSDRRYWHKTLIVVPPVPAKRLQDRWRSFMAACTMPGRFTAPSPAGRPVLVMSCPESRWRAVTANHRSEWSYAAALNAAPGHETPLDDALRQDPPGLVSYRPWPGLLRDLHPRLARLASTARAGCCGGCPTRCGSRRSAACWASTGIPAG